MFTFTKCIRIGIPISSTLLIMSMLSHALGQHAQEAIGQPYSSPGSSNVSSIVVSQFVDISATAGIGGIPEYGGHAILFADVNRDGREDMYVTHTNFDPNNSGQFLVLPDELFINNGDYTYTENATAAGVEDPGQSHGAIFVDIDNDGDLDLFNGQRGPHGNRLYRNDGNGIFTDITSQAGILLESRATIAVLAFDIDNDGDMDLFSGNWGFENEMYVNDGTGKFTLEDRGANDFAPDPAGKMAATAADVDNDGDVDFFVAKRSDTCRLYINDGNGFFSDQAGGRGVAFRGISDGAVFVDIDRDADLDMLLATYNGVLRVYRNRGDGTFVDETGIHNIPLNGYTVNAGDLNNDGHPDIFLSINFGMSSLWLNDGTGHFVKQSGTGLERDGIDARATTFGDIDSDGDLDVAVTYIQEPTLLYRNDLIAVGTPAQNYLQIAVTPANGSAAAFNTKFYLYEAGHLDQAAFLRGYQEFTPTQGTFSQSSPIMHFGVSPANNYDLRVRFLDGTSLVRTNIAPGQRLHLNPNPDTTPPVISNVAAVSNLSTSATIQWNTDEPATSQVEYGLDTNYGSSSTFDPALANLHGVTLSGLTANTTYHYRVKSQDASGNLAVSGDFTFATSSASLLFSDDFNGGGLDANKWRRGANAGNQSAVTNNRLELRSAGTETGWIVTRNAFAGRSTTVTVKVVQPNDDGDLGMSPTYSLPSLYGIYGEATWYRFYVYRNNSSGPYLLYVQWKKNGVVDGLDVTGNMVINGAVYLRLRMDETRVYFEASLNGQNWLERYSEPFGLPGHTLANNFYYELAGYNTSQRGVLIVDDFSISSAVGIPPDTTAPQISEVTTSAITNSSATITWTTDEASDSQVEYGPTTAYGFSSLLDSTLVVSHAVTLSGLTNNSTYHYRVKSRDAAGNLAVSSDFTFTTLNTTLLFSDNFNSGNLDNGKWRRGTNAGNQSRVANNRLELRSDGNETGWIITRNTFVGRNTTVAVKVVQPNNDGDWGISPTYSLSSLNGIYNEAAWYRFYVYRDNASGPYLLYVQWKKNGVVDGRDVTGSMVINGAVYLRLRMDETRIHFEASLDGQTWLEQYSEVFALPGYTLNNNFYYELAGYRTSQKGVLIIDDFSISAASSALAEMSSNAAGVETRSSLPERFALSQNYPNPFNIATRFAFELPENGRVQAVIFNLQGQMVVRLHDGDFAAGHHAIQWSGENQFGQEVSSGVYVLRMTFEATSGRRVTVTRRLALMK